MQDADLYRGKGLCLDHGWRYSTYHCHDYPWLGLAHSERASIPFFQHAPAPCLPFPLPPSPASVQPLAEAVEIPASTSAAEISPFVTALTKPFTVGSTSFGRRH